MEAQVEHTYADLEAYKLPNDPYEQSRLDYQHSCIYGLLGNRISLAPTKSPNRILDIGCGTGACTRDFATQNPAAKVYGVDLTPVPDSRNNITPSNVSYITGNVRDLANTDDRLRPASFDLVFSRLLIYGMRDWPGYVKAAAELTAPGGWVEMQDLDLHVNFNGEPRDPEWMQIIRQVAEERGMDFDCGSNIAGYMRDAGLTDIETKKFFWPLGTWMKDEHPETEEWGIYVSKNVGEMQFHFVKAMLGDDPRWSEDEVKRLQKQAWESMQPTDGAYIGYYVTYGRKP